MTKRKREPLTFGEIESDVSDTEARKGGRPRGLPCKHPTKEKPVCDACQYERDRKNKRG